MTNPLWLIIEREYKSRVAKKSFILTTLLTPLVMVGAIALMVVMMISTETTSRVAVIDNSGVVADKISSSETLDVLSVTGMTVDSALRRSDLDGVLVIPADIVKRQHTQLRYYSNGPTSMTIEGELRHKVENAVEQIRLDQNDIPHLKEIVDGLQCDVTINTYRNDKDPDEESTSSMANYAVGYLLTFLLYMFILLYGQLIMTSIIEEKNNRVMEVVVSSVSPTKLMMGKILGTAMVAVTQIIIWVVLIGVLFGMLLPALIPAETMTELAAYQAGTAGADVDTESMEMLGNVMRLTSLSYLAGMAALTIAFLVGGFLFYAAVFAAVGASVDNAQDASQLTMFAALPTIVGMMIGMTACADPNTSIAFWFSIIPFTSPMVMMARIPSGIPGWEIALSLVLLYASVLGMIRLAAKIYRVGIFMYGKKPTVKDLARWVRYK